MKKYSFFLWFTCTILGDNTTTLHNYLWANYNHFSGHNDQARTWYKEIFATKHSPYVYKGHLYLLDSSQEYAAITALIPSLNKKFEKDPEIQLIFANALEKTNHIKEADNHIIRLSQLFKTDSEITLRASQTYMRRKEPENALLAIESFLNNTPRRPHNFVFHFLKTQIYLQLSKFNDALNSINACLELHPNFDKGWLLYASLCEKEGKIKQALSGYATFLEHAPANPIIEKHLCALTLKYQSTHNNNAVLLSNTITIENALTLFKQQRYPQALMHINSCLALTPMDIECKLLKLHIISAMQDFTQVEQILTEWITKEPDTDIWAQSLYLLTHHAIPRIHAINIFNAIIKQVKNNAWLNLYCADLCIRDNQTDQAITCLNNALICSLDNPLRIKTLYQLSLLHYEKGNYQLMLNHLENAYALNQNSAHINNALAYYWATKGKNLSKAHSFIAASLNIDNTNPYFLDTHALILYKEKKYTHAQQILEQLEHHNNGTMLLHLAQVNYALNNKEIADNLTKKAHVLVKNYHEKKALNKMELLLASK